MTDLYVDQADDETVNVGPIIAADGSYLAVTTHTTTLVVKASKQATDASGITYVGTFSGTNAAGWVAQFSVPKADLAVLGVRFYRCRVVDPAGKVQTAAAGRFVVDTGRRTAGQAPSSPSDVALAVAAYVPLAQRGAASGVATLGADSKIPGAQLPDLSISDYLGAAANQAAMLALVGQRGDWATRTDTNTTWMLKGDDASVLANWQQLATPTDVVTSVDGQVGAVALGATYVPLAGKVFAAAPTGDATTDTASLVAAKAALPNGRGTIVLRPGVYIHTGLNFDNSRGVKFEVSGGQFPAVVAGLYGAAELRYVSSGAGVAVSAVNSWGFTLGESVALTYSSATFTGTVLNLTGGYAPAFDRCLVGGIAGASGAAILVDLDTAICAQATRLQLQNAVRGIRGKSSQASYSNAHHLDVFHTGGITTCVIWNPGDGWEVSGTFERLANLAPGAIGHDAGVTARGLEVHAAWFGDDEAVGAWITFAGSGLDVHGVYGSTSLPGSSLVKLDQNGCVGVSINGVGCVAVAGSWLLDLGVTTGHGPMAIGPASFGGATQVPLINGTLPKGSIVLGNVGDSSNLPNRAGEVAGEYIGSLGSPVGSQALTNGEMLFCLLWLDAGPFDRLCAQLVTAGTAGTAKLALYADANGRPAGAPVVVGAGTVNLTSVLAQELVVAYTVPHDGWYWLAINPSAITGSPAVYAIQTERRVNFSGAAFAIQNLRFGWAMTGVTAGVTPTIAGLAVSVSLPSFAVRKA